MGLKIQKIYIEEANISYLFQKVRRRNRNGCENMKKPIVISVSTSKGGVGKTTTTVALAEFLAEKKKKILVVDADYQTNATIALIGNEKWEKLNSENKTLKALLEDAINEGKQGYQRQFDPSTHIFKRASNLAGGPVGDRIDLLPSTPDLNDVKNNLYLAGRDSPFAAVNKINFLEWGLRDILPQYDFVLIDTHPDIDNMLHAAFYISDYVLMPVIPDAVSSYGVKIMNTHIKKFSKGCRLPIKFIGVLFSMERPANVHRTYRALIETLCKNEGIPVFKTFIPLRATVTQAMEYSDPKSTLKQKYGYGEIYDNYQNLVEEVLSQLNPPKLFD